MNQNAPVTIESFAAEFASHHVAKLVQLSRKVDEILAKPDPKLSELEAALRIELRIERYLYQLSQRREREERAAERRAKSARKELAPKPSVPPACPPSQAAVPKPTQTPQTPKPPAGSPPVAPAQPLATSAAHLAAVVCHLKNHGIKSESCPGCGGGLCKLIP